MTVGFAFWGLVLGEREFVLMEAKCRSLDCGREALTTARELQARSSLGMTAVVRG